MQQSVKGELHSLREANKQLNFELKLLSSSKEEEIENKVHSYKGQIEQEYYHSLHSTMEAKFKSYEESLAELTKKALSALESVVKALPECQVKVLPTMGTINNCK